MLIPFPYKLILASNSPRRKELLAGLNLDFEVKVIPGIDENYPADMPTENIARYLAELKAKPYEGIVADKEIVITADTVVIVNSHVLGKPKDAAQARAMLQELSGCTHEVATGVCFTSLKRKHSFSVSTKVTFGTLSSEEIDYYIDRYRPFDKAGAYGIQEWIGYVGVTRLEGSYFNVMGLPVQRIWTELQRFVDDSHEDSVL